MGKSIQMVDDGEREESRTALAANGEVNLTHEQKTDDTRVAQL